MGVFMNTVLAVDVDPSRTIEQQIELGEMKVDHPLVETTSSL
jgi:hypothetical protein